MGVRRRPQRRHGTDGVALVAAPYVGVNFGRVHVLALAVHLKGTTARSHFRRGGDKYLGVAAGR